MRWRLLRLERLGVSTGRFLRTGASGLRERPVAAATETASAAKASAA